MELNGLDTINWSLWPQPERNKPTTIQAVLRDASRVDSLLEQRDAYNEIMFAVGNNHGGTFYPVVLPALPFFQVMLRDGNELVKEMVLDVLTDLAGSFFPEPGFEEWNSRSGETICLKSAVVQGIREMLPEIRACRTPAGHVHSSRISPAARANDLARDLERYLNGIACEQS